MAGRAIVQQYHDKNKFILNDEVCYVLDQTFG